MVICSTAPPLTALVALVFGLLLASASQSQATAGEPLRLWPSPPPRSPRPPPPPSRSPPSPPSTPPRPPKSPYTSRRDPRLPLLPPSTLNNHSPPPSWRKPIQGPLPLPPPPPPSLTAKPKRKTHKLGKKVGISFAGIAVIMQFAVAGFLAYKKKQIYRLRD